MKTKTEPDYKKIFGDLVGWVFRDFPYASTREIFNVKSLSDIPVTVEQSDEFRDKRRCLPLFFYISPGSEPKSDRSYLAVIIEDLKSEIFGDTSLVREAKRELVRRASDSRCGAHTQEIGGRDHLVARICCLDKGDPEIIYNMVKRYYETEGRVVQLTLGFQSAIESYGTVKNPSSVDDVLLAGRLLR